MVDYKIKMCDLVKKPKNFSHSLNRGGEEVC